jgi:hypothetical protein
MPSRQEQVNQLNFVCEDCYFPARDSSHLRQHKSVGKCSPSPLYPDVDNMTSDEQEEFIHNTQRYKTELDLLDRTPEFAPIVRGINIGDDTDGIKKLKKKYESQKFRVFRSVVKFYAKEFENQKRIQQKKEENERHYKQLQLQKQQQEQKRNSEKMIKEAKNLLELQKLKELEEERNKEAQRKREQKALEDEAKARIANIKIKTKEQTIQLATGTIAPISILQSIYSSSIYEEEQSEHYSIEIPQLTRNTYIEHIINEPTPEPEPTHEPTIVPIPEPEPTHEPTPEPTPEPEPEQQQEQQEEEEPERDPNNFYMTNRFANRRRGIQERWDNPDVFKEWKEKPTILAKDTTIDTLVDDGYCRIDRINIKDTHEHKQEFYVSRYNRETLYHETEPTYNEREDTLEFGDETYQPEYYPPLDKYRCVCGCRRVIGWSNEHLSVNKDYDDDDMSCAFREHNLYIKYKGDWKAILKHQHLHLSPLE